MDENQNDLLGIPNWLPKNITAFRGEYVQIRILYGADILDSFVAKKQSIGSNTQSSWTDQEVFWILILQTIQMNIELRIKFLISIPFNAD